MLKKLLIPCLFLAAAVAINSGGCGSSSGGGTAGKGGGSGGSKAGSGGSTAGSTGAAGSTGGSTAGSTGAAGSTAGSGGATAGSTGTAGSTADGGGGSTGAAGSTADGGGGSTGAAGSTADGGGADTAIPTCTSTTATSTAMSAADFCKIFLADCGTGHTGYADMAACMTSYTGNSATLMQCQSYHLCNANGFAAGNANRTTHCTHAGTDTGNGVCTKP